MLKRTKPVRTVWERGVFCAKHLFSLETHVDNGISTTISERLRRYVRGLLAIAWYRGYRAGRKDAKR